MLRRLILAVVIFALTFGTSCFSGIGPLEIISSVLNDDTGNTFIAYRVERSPGDHDIHLQKISPDGAVLWNNALFTGDDRRASVMGMVSDGNKGVFVAWEVLTPENGKEGPHRFDRITLAKVDAQGKTLWRKDIYEKGTQVINDGSDGAIILWPTKEGPCARRIGADGNLRWEKCLSGSGHGLKLASDEMGGALILWDNRDNPYFVAQKLGADGQILWAQEGMPEGIRIKYIEGPFEQKPQIVSDGSGGAIITWAEVTSEGMPCYIWVLKIGTDGGVLWYDPVRELTALVHPTTGLVSDGSGGAIVVWEDHRQGMALYAQKVNFEGEGQWQENGVPACTGLPEVSPRFEVTGNGDGGVVVAWIDGDRKLYAQMLDAFGQKQWDDKGILIAKGTCHLPVQLCGDNQGSFIIGWSTGVEAYHPNDSYLQKIDSDGNLLWGEEGVRISP